MVYAATGSCVSVSGVRLSVPSLYQSQHIYKVRMRQFIIGVLSSSSSSSSSSIFVVFSFNNQLSNSTETTVDYTKVQV